MAGCVQIDTDPAGFYECSWMHFDHLSPCLINRCTKICSGAKTFPVPAPFSCKEILSPYQEYISRSGGAADLKKACLSRNCAESTPSRYRPGWRAGTRGAAWPARVV